ncbi:hypothetical protein RDI58_004441 [Solanum bulbocastanum]|uniref:MULE transposase domain-containing protein n=1 Tax=Solanum bulbocastanum TaxID=147425 RepID=A0AAN8TYV1_SOLBU
MNATEVRKELYSSLAMASYDSLMNENEWVDNDSYYSLNNDVHLDEDDEEVENNEEHILGDELEEYSVNGEPYDTFTEEDVSVGPISGMQFKDENTLFSLYKEHERFKGFSIVKRNSKRIAGDTANYGFWSVSKVFNEHNHELLPAIARLVADHRSISQSLKRDLVAHDRSGIRPSKNIRFAEIKAREFFYSIDVDNSGRLQNVVWVHSHCHFHDAICFDTTYLVNHYNMPFASFVGINHHRQSILLGCALMSHEDIVSYKLIFRTWLEAMGNVHPNAIITDQCPSIKPAIAEVMPHTVHRY